MSTFFYMSPVPIFSVTGGHIRNYRERLPPSTCRHEIFVSWPLFEPPLAYLCAAPITAMKCRGRFQRIALAHIFETDVLQTRFPGRPAPAVTDQPFWFTLTSGFLASACEVLAIDRGDLDGTYRSCTGEDHTGELVIYDRVPGGAGHAERIQENLRPILRAVLDRLRNCPNPQCALDSSCYTCLRSHRNQFHWDALQRSAPIPWLESLALG